MSSAAGSKVTINHLSAGRIPDGATVEKSVATPVADGDSIQLDLNASDYGTAREVVRAPPSLQGVTPEPLDVLVALAAGPSRRVDLPALYVGTRTGALPLGGFRDLDREQAHLRVDAFVEDGSTDLKTSFALPLPLTVISHVVGLDSSRADWIGAALGFFLGPRDIHHPGTPEEKAQLLLDLHEYIREVMAARRHDRRDDLISHVWNERDAGAVEMTSSLPSKFYVAGARRLGLPEKAWRYFDEHVEADAAHEQVAVRDVCGQLVAQHPETLPTLLTGAVVGLTVEAAVAEQAMGAWHHGRSCLRVPLRPGAAA